MGNFISCYIITLKYHHFASCLAKLKYLLSNSLQKKCVYFCYKQWWVIWILFKQGEDGTSSDFDNDLNEKKNAEILNKESDRRHLNKKKL